MPGNRMIKGQPHSLAYMTGQEMEAMNQLKSEPGLRGRLARKGARKKMNIVDGVPAFAVEDEADRYSSEYSGSNEPQRSEPNQFSTDPADAMAYMQSQNQGGGGGGGGNRGFSGVAQAKYDQLQKDFDDYKAGEAGRKEEAIEGYRGERRQQLTDEFGGYKDRYKSLEDQYDLSAERGQMQDLGREAQALGSKFEGQMEGIQSGLRGYEQDLTGLRSDVSGLRQQQAGIGQQLGGLAQQALDPTSTDAYAKNRAMLSGLAESQRKAQSQGAQEQLMRGMAGAGSSPEQIAMAKAKLAQGQGQQARQDALSSAMGAQQMTGQQLAQGAGLLGQQAGMGMQQANLLGQQAGLTQAGAGLGMQQAGLYGQAAGFQSGLLGQRGGFASQSANLLQNQLQGKSGMMDRQVGMTESQLQDVVAQQNQAFEKDMAEKGYAMQRDAARMSRPQGPSQFDQLLSTAATVAPIVAAFSDKTLKKNVRNAKDKDLMKPKEIDGFLNSLYAKQYNYKDPKHGEGKQVGIMAQDVEKTQLGKQMVENTPEGKQINAAKGLGLVMASQARLNERLNAIGA